MKIASILKATADEYGVKAGEYCGFRSGAMGRDIAAMLCRRWTRTTLRELSKKITDLGRAAGLERDLLEVTQRGSMDRDG